jgi:signal transduction histidine kinase
VLRAVDEAAPRTPAPSLTRMDDLIERLSAAGLAVEVTVTGEQRELPVDVDLAAYRIVQESLTNVHRHAGVSTARIELGYEPERLVITVTDDGRGGEAMEGNGLAGMRERAASLGGMITAGPGGNGGFVVQAVLPLAAHGEDGAA